jgi:hypothetical protein
VTGLADRGFGDPVRDALVDTLGSSSVIRFRGAMLVEHEDQQKPVSEWLAPHTRARKLDGARVTANRTQVGAVMTVRAKSMKQAWYLATNVEKATTTEIVKLDGRRFTIEETFRDEKGKGLRATHIRNAARRDRLLMLLAIATALERLVPRAS